MQPSTEIQKQPMKENWRTLLDKGVFHFFKDIVKISLFHPSWWRATFFLLISQIQSARKRLASQKKGIMVPPFMILSVTDKCNLKCAGCYAKALHPAKKESLKTERLVELLSEAHKLGVSSVLLAGGEPLTRPDLLSMTRKFPSLGFALFTNGTLLDEEKVRELRHHRHVVPIISLEGHKTATDARRGSGVYDACKSAIALCKKNSLLFGCSVTVDRENFSETINSTWISAMYSEGCRFFVFVEYVPVDNSASAKAITIEQRTRLATTAAALHRQYNALFIVFPGDEAEYGGCLAAGRGFIHINASGDLEPCPFAPFSDRSLAQGSLENALRSPLFEKIRNGHASLRETEGGCALWREREWVASLVDAEKSPLHPSCP